MHFIVISFISTEVLTLLTQWFTLHWEHQVKCTARSYILFMVLIGLTYTDAMTCRKFIYSIFKVNWNTKITTLSQAEGLASLVHCLRQSHELEVYQNTGKTQQYSIYSSELLAISAWALPVQLDIPTSLCLTVFNELFF